MIGRTEPAMNFAIAICSFGIDQNKQDMSLVSKLNSIHITLASFLKSLCCDYVHKKGEQDSRK